MNYVWLVFVSTTVYSTLIIIKRHTYCVKSLSLKNKYLLFEILTVLMLNGTIYNPVTLQQILKFSSDSWNSLYSIVLQQSDSIIP